MKQLPKGALYLVGCALSLGVSYVLDHYHGRVSALELECEALTEDNDELARENGELRGLIVEFEDREAADLEAPDLDVFRDAAALRPQPCPCAERRGDAPGPCRCAEARAARAAAARLQLGDEPAAADVAPDPEAEQQAPGAVASVTAALSMGAAE